MQLAQVQENGNETELKKYFGLDSFWRHGKVYSNPRSANPMICSTALFILADTTPTFVCFQENSTFRSPGVAKSQNGRSTDRSEPPFRTVSFSDRKKSPNRLPKGPPRTQNGAKINRSGPQSDRFPKRSDPFTDRIH